jgi:hypothetical protein
VGGGSAPRPLRGSVGASGSLHFFLSYFISLMLLHPPLESGETLCITCIACIHALEGAQVPYDHMEMIKIYFYSKCIFWILHQPMSPSGMVLAPRPLQGSARASDSWHFFLSYFSTLMLLHAPLEARESLCVVFEACIHAIESA